MNTLYVTTQNHSQDLTYVLSVFMFLHSNSDDKKTFLKSEISIYVKWPIDFKNEIVTI